MASASALSRPTSATGIGRRVLAGVAGGIAGGIVFGMLMAMMDMLPVIASIVGSASAVVGFGVHLMISVMIGLGLTVLLGNRFLTGYGRGALVGLGYGAIWWVLSPLMIMPVMMGMPLFTVDLTALMSLMGHMIYGVILGVVAVRVLKSRA
ncbi:UNVERIFIED_ORG: putative membrane protein YagU involved in acid resistance [Arthrobacter sp. UYEF13]